MVPDRWNPWAELAAPAVAPPPPAAPGPAPTYRAGGSEPGWALTLAEGGNALSLQGEPLVQWDMPTPAQAVNGARRWSQTVNGTPLQVTAQPILCHDVATGMPKPDTVSLSWGGREFKGCGGDTASLLTGAEWTVYRLLGQPMAERSRVTLRFSPDGRVSGMASCNHYTGAWHLTAERLTLNPPAVTMMACAPMAMTQEDKFLALFKAVRRFDLTPQGELLLIAPDGRQMRARREPA